jgi:hypothetical protein
VHQLALELDRGQPGREGREQGPKDESGSYGSSDGSTFHETQVKSKMSGHVSRWAGICVANTNWKELKGIWRSASPSTKHENVA